MNPVRVSQTGTGVSRPIMMDWLQNPFNIGGTTTISGGTITDHAVQHTFDDILTVPSGSVVWKNNSAFTPGVHAAGLDFNYAFAVRAIRLNVIDGTGGGTVTMDVVQSSDVP